MGLTAGEIVKLARHQERLTSLDYFEKFLPIFKNSMVIVYSVMILRLLAELRILQESQSL